MHMTTPQSARCSRLDSRADIRLSALRSLAA